MENNYRTIFNNEIQPPAHLRAAVLSRIAEFRALQIKKRKIRFIFGFVISGICFVAACFVFGYQLMASDFWSIASLGFTDLGVLLAHWQEYGISLLETFPALSVAGILLPVFVFMLLLKQYAKELYHNNLNLKFN